MSPSQFFLGETPPRPWGRRTPPRHPPGLFRNTPTPVGKTRSIVTTPANGKKHPHARGEDVTFKEQLWPDSETPPRPWGRRSQKAKFILQVRNTPTPVGKTMCEAAKEGESEKHPHARGEDPCGHRVPNKGGETPPRPWGRQCPRTANHIDYRNTPTPVGKTQKHSDGSAVRRKHPHARGEDDHRQFETACNMETPPRPWGRPLQALRECFGYGNTPTPVGKTNVMRGTISVKEKHPHARGEDSYQVAHSIVDEETPPRPWGRQRN